MSQQLRARMLAAALVSLCIIASTARPAPATTYTWTTGNFIAGTTAPNPLISPDVLQINHGGSKAFDGITFDNQSLVLLECRRSAAAKWLYRQRGPLGSYQRQLFQLHLEHSLHLQQ